MPDTLLRRTSGTMVSPWPPMTTAVTFSTLDLEFRGDEGAETGRIEHARHADDAMLGEPETL